MLGIDLVKEKVMEQISLKVHKIGWHKKAKIIDWSLSLFNYKMYFPLNNKCETKSLNIIVQSAWLFCG